MMNMPWPWLLESGGLSPEEDRKERDKIAWRECEGGLLPEEREQEEQGPKWDCLVLTAMNEQQKRIFELQLEDIPWERYAHKCVVVVDPPGARAGSGGATVWVLKESRKHGHFDAEARVLLIHSGGYSQRTPHLSNVGKVFMATPQDGTLLQLKLRELRNLLPALPAGIFIAASDVLEKVPKQVDPMGDDVDVFLLMHRSPLKTAENHGVYIVDADGELVRAMHMEKEQPVLAQLQQQHECAVRQEKSGNPWCYTDSSYFLSSRTAAKLLDYVANHAQLEICAYRDFLRPLGSEPEEISSVIKSPLPPEHMFWLCSLNACFSQCKTQLLDCGADSFYHFGSIEECRQHFHGVLGGRAIPIQSTWEYKVGAGSIVEYSNLNPSPFVEVGARSIVSCVYTEPNQNFKEIRIPDDVVVYSTPVQKGDIQGWVTVVIGTADDVKRAFDQGAVQWSGTTITDYEGTSLWEAPLFTMTRNPEQSLEKSLRKYKHRSTDPEALGCCGWSMADVVRHVDARRLVEYRRQRASLWWRYGPESPGQPSSPYGFATQTNCRSPPGF